MSRRAWILGAGALVQLAILGVLFSSLGGLHVPDRRPSSFLLPPVKPPKPADRPAPQRDGVGPQSQFIWWVADQLAAHGVLIVHVETDRVDAAIAIARQLIEPVKSSYVEVLVYFYPAGKTRERALTRVQWTPQAGYVELRLGE